MPSVAKKVPVRFMKFRLLEGQHVQKDPRRPEGKSRTYNKGDLIEATIDLCERFNTPLGAKFERVYAEQSRKAPPVEEEEETTEEPDPVSEPSDSENAGEDEGTPDEVEDILGRARAKGPEGDDGLDELSQPELKELAREEGIDVRKCKTRALILQTIREARLAPPEE